MSIWLLKSKIPEADLSKSSTETMEAKERDLAICLSIHPSIFILPSCYPAQIDHNGDSCYICPA